MKSTPAVLLVCLALATVALVIWLVGGRSADAPAAPVASTLPARAVPAGSAAEHAAPAAGTSDRHVVAAAEVAAPTHAVGAASGGTEPPSAEQRERDSILAKLRGRNLEAGEQSKLWRRLAELGMADEVIAALQAECALAPRDSHLLTMLGNAYITKMRSETLSPADRRATSQAAMASFDKALELDPQNWTARFSRAMSNSSAPAFLGLQKNAIEDFETLIAQQKLLPLSPDHAHTYAFLGNLLVGSGNAQRAQEVRAEARQLFPGDARFQN